MFTDTAFIDRADIKEYVPLPPPEAIYWMLRTCFLELMAKGAMKKLEVQAWIGAKKAYEKDLSSRSSRVNGHTSNGTKLSKEERSSILGLGLARLAYRCHVSSRHYQLCDWLEGKLILGVGVQNVWTYIEANAYDGSYSIYRSTEISFFLGRAYYQSTRKVVGCNGEVCRGRAGGSGKDRMGQDGCVAVISVLLRRCIESADGQYGICVGAERCIGRSHIEYSILIVVIIVIVQVENIISMAWLQYLNLTRQERKSFITLFFTLYMIC